MSTQDQTPEVEPTSDGAEGGPLPADWPWLDGDQLSAISGAITGLHRRYYGRGANRARTFQPYPDLLITELRDVYLTVEHTLLGRGRQDTVRQTRQTFQQSMQAEFIDAVEQASNRRILSFTSAMIIHPEAILEIFYLEPAQQTAPDDGQPIPAA